MKLRIVLALGTGVLLGVIGTAGVRVAAQQQLRRTETPSVITPHGFLAEEVRVGESCVVIVSTVAGNGPHEIAVSPCQR